MSTDKSCVIIGAGIAGLMAGKKLNEKGVHVTVLDKGRGVGGRLATRRIANNVFDHGAQFFSAQDANFKTYVSEWVSGNIIRIWGKKGEIYPENGKDNDQHVYIGSAGMTSLAKYLAGDLTIELNRRAEVLNYFNDHWEIKTNTQEIFETEALILTPPLPQSLELLNSGNLPSLNGLRTQMENIKYNACISLMVVFDDMVDLPDAGALKLSGEPLAWMADNCRKGISKGLSAVTIHTGTEFSRMYWQQDDEMLAKNILYIASGWLKAPYREYQLKRWKYSRPSSTFNQTFCKLPTKIPLVLAGDAFGGPHIEGAALSGLSAAEEILSSMNFKRPD
jgi:predicted NAD/FAD-dependent oxidoreductase